MQGVGTGERADDAVEQHMVRALSSCVQVEVASIGVPALALKVVVTLHQVIVVVYLRQATLGLQLR
jgi:hypothetical protein